MKLIPGDWLTNAGLLGYLRICELAGHKPDYSKDFIEIKSSDLNHFTEYYFTAILMRWTERIFRSRYNIFKELQDKIDGEKFEKLSRSSFRDIKPKYYAFSQTQKAIIKAANDYKKKSLDLLSKELGRSKDEIDSKNFKKIKKRLGNSISKDIEWLRDKRLNFVYIYLQSFYRNKRVIGNPSISKIGRKRAFYRTYVKPAIEQLNNSANTHKSSDGFLCRFCKQNRVMPERFDDVDSIFAEGMFSTTAITISFKNFFYNMQPDLFICEVCQLLLICAWAGFTPIPWRFRDDFVNTDHIFVNLPSLHLLWKENKEIDRLCKQSGERVQGTVYELIIRDIFLRLHETKARWAIENILFIEIMATTKKHERRPPPNLRYFHIGQDIAYLFKNEHAINAFRHISGRLKAGKNLEHRLDLRRNVIARILENNSLIPLCYLLVITSLRSENKYHLSNLFNILVISCIRRSIVTEISRGGNPYMLDSKVIFGTLIGMQKEGSSFLNEPFLMGYEERKRKSYILLSMIRNNRIEDFYHILLQIYMSKNKPIPDRLVGLLNAQDEIGFHAKAYAFMSGFLSGTIATKQQQKQQT